MSSAVIAKLEGDALTTGELERLRAFVRSEQNLSLIHI